MPLDRTRIEDEIEERFVAASGPGGQNVNKVATAVQLRFNVARSAAFSEEERERVAAALRARLTLGGDLVLHVQEHRTQAANRQAARERLFALLEAAMKRRRKRVPTRPTRASKERRLSAKSQRGEIKRGRGRIGPE